MCRRPMIASVLLASTFSLCAMPAMAEEKFIGYISPIASQPLQQVQAKAMDDRALSLGWSTRVLDANLSPDRQVSHVDTLITMGAAAIASWSLDPNSVAAAYTRANAAGIPVLGVNSDGEGVGRSVWWAINRCEPGGPHAQQAQWIAERSPGAKLVVMGGPPAPSIMANVACFTAAAQAAGLEVLAQVDNSKDSAPNAATLAGNILTRHPDVQAFWAYNDQSALGISAALMSNGQSIYGAGVTEGVMVFGINGDSDALQAVRDGRMTGTWDPDNYATGVAIAVAIEGMLAEPEADLDDLVIASTLYTSDNIANRPTDEGRKLTPETLPLVK